MPATTAAPSGSRFETMRRPFTTVGEGIGVGVVEGLGVAVAVGLAVAPVIGIVQAASVTDRANTASIGRRMSTRDSSAGRRDSRNAPAFSHYGCLWSSRAAGQ